MTTGQHAGVRSTGLQDDTPERQERLRRLARVRRAAGYLVTAEILERRADEAASPVLASLLRERAGQRRSLGKRLLAPPPGARPAPRTEGEAVRARRL
jgi:hypothetical protein